MQEREDSEEGEAPADPSAGEWLPGGAGCYTTHRRPRRAVLAGCVPQGSLQALGPAWGLLDRQWP